MSLPNTDTTTPAVLMDTVYENDTLVAEGIAEVFVAASKLGWNTYIAFGKLSITQPDIFETDSGKKYMQVWQTEPYQQNGVSAVLAVGESKEGNHVFAKKADGKLWRKRVTGLNAYNIAMTNTGKLVKYEAGHVAKAKTDTFDTSF